MYRYVMKRILMMIPMLLGISFLVFAIISLTPGNPAQLILGQNAPAQAVAALSEEMGLNRPFPVRFADYVFSAARGDFGVSYVTGQPVFGEIFSRFPITFSLSLSAVCLAVLIGIPLGILSSVRRYSGLDIGSTVMAMLMSSIPEFWFGIMMMFIFSLKLGLLPSYGTGTAAHLIMPTVTLAIPCAAKLLRLTRSTMLEVIRQDYIQTAIAKGVSGRSVIWKHSLKNALLPVITVTGMSFGRMVGGTVIVESIFSISGLGSLVLDAIRMKDIPQIMAAVIFLSLLFGLIMLGVDLLYAFVDPRTRARYQR